MALEPTPRRRVPIPGSWLVPAAFLVVGLGVGFGLGWVLHGGSSSPGGSGGTPATTTATSTTATTPQAPPPRGPQALRASVRLVILNGTDITGLAARTATRARRLGYRHVETGNGPREPRRSENYYRPGALAAARLVARDFGSSAPQPLPTGSPLRAQAPRGTVFLLLGPPGFAARG